MKACLSKLETEEGVAYVVEPIGPWLLPAAAAAGRLVTAATAPRGSSAAATPSSHPPVPLAGRMKAVAFEPLSDDVMIVCPPK